MERNKIITLAESFIYQSEELVLSNVNLQIEEGEFVYLIGRVGSGKSSLIKVLNAEIPLSGGRGTVAGYELSRIKTREIPFLRRKLGVIFQDFKLLPDRNVEANFRFVLEATGWKDKVAITNRIKEVLKEVEMEGCEKKMPHRLSGGEQQRIVIARALLNNPDIILADEPTGNLDPETSEQILNLFVKINGEGKTIIMATHDYPLLEKFPSKTLLCENKKLVEVSNENEEVDFEAMLK
ncbi:ATP-binding cassette domain-containing protein [Puteibacter caeruleilacunae]|nr:ATP-binding cassette domain-containing protein [Puteibacter caeruleilacunae]